MDLLVGCVVASLRTLCERAHCDVRYMDAAQRLWHLHSLKVRALETIIASRGEVCTDLDTHTHRNTFASTLRELSTPTYLKSLFMIQALS